jgi:hexulose-6-phosphate isomerase
MNHLGTPPVATQLSRRRFGAAVAGCVAAAGFGPLSRGAAAAPVTVRKPTFLKAVKWGMILEGETPLDKFQLCKELGYDGMELVSPLDAPMEELRAASRATGMPIHGLVDMKHWDVRLSAPDQATRDAGRAILEQAIRDAHAMGGHSVLLVPGKVGDDASHEEVWSRSIPEIQQVLPVAASLGVRVLIENVWNGFCETPEEARDYLDEIGSPWVGAYFDIGNCRKFGASEDWVRTLGNRIVKLDVKDWGDTEGFCKIGDGDVNWPAVRTALAEIGYHGWCTAEVEGGGRAELADIASRMDRVLVG